jgi:hypothetical protein
MEFPDRTYLPERFVSRSRGIPNERSISVKWDEKHKNLIEQLEIFRKLEERFGKEVIEIAGKAKMDVHKKWMKELSQHKSGRPSEIFRHSAFSVTSDEESLLEYEVLEDSDDKFAVKITKCKYADFYLARGAPEIGYHMHCALDFGETEAFSSCFILKRTKTLMQGDSYCNHCYELKQSKSRI